MFRGLVSWKLMLAFTDRYHRRGVRCGDGRVSVQGARGRRAVRGVWRGHVQLGRGQRGGVHAVLLLWPDGAVRVGAAVCAGGQVHAGE